MIEVFRQPPCVIVNGFRIVTAPPVGELVAAIGTQTRVEAGPAPAGFRNPQRHVFDALGVSVLEHHYTRRATAISMVHFADEPRSVDTPASTFAGELWLDGVEMPRGATEKEFLAASPWPFERVIGGIWRLEFGGFSVIANMVGPRLRSGRRSARRVVGVVEISWPHDPWESPAH
ncbi:MAG: hypothetical protein GC200_08365 [Tepidisphaera sp.]|nr:hypothetical protein [Tepidisphaera sp.]